MPVSPTLMRPEALAPATTIVDVFRDDARTLGDRPALRRRTSDGWEVVTWTDYGETVARLAAGLVELGVEHGDRVALLSSNRVEWHQADLAIVLIGGVTVPVYATSASTQVAYTMSHSEAKVAFVEDVDQLSKVLLRRHELPMLERVVLFEQPNGLDGGFVLALDELERLGVARLAREPGVVDGRARAVAPEDLCTLVYTSGTTGPPKGVMITHANVMSTVRSITGVVPITPDDRFLSFLPLSHIAERVVSHFGQLVAGGETWFAQSMATVPRDLRECRPTIFFAVPRVWEKLHAGVLDSARHEPAVMRRPLERYLRLLEGAVAAERAGTREPVGDRLARAAMGATLGAAIRRRLGLDKARILVSGAAPIHADLLRWFRHLGLPIAEVYGQTEDCGPTSLNPPDRIRIGTVGPPIPGVEVRIAADGEILVRGGNVCAGYFKDEAATEALLADGWMHSGDLGSVDGDGYLRITGRKKDLIINSAGKNIAPQEIETRLRHEPLIGQAVVIGDGKPYLVALLTLDPDDAAAWAADHSRVGTLEVLAQDPGVLDEIERSVQRVNAEHARVEGIKRWRLLPEQLTVDSGELTPTLKVRRQAVTEHHSDLIDQLYAG
jgi:long-chain acyl-CoA synthetase